MQFTNPIALWGLLGLTLPVAIHLLSRKEGKVIRIGSLRHLHETNTQQFKGIRLNEIALLSLRTLMIILFVLVLSGLSFHRNTSSETKWVVIEKGLEKKTDVQSQIEKFQSEGYEVRWLAKEFPLLIDSSSISPVQYREAVEKISALASEALIITQNKLSGFSGVRPALPPNVRWISITPEPVEYTLSAIGLADSIVVRTGNSSASKTYFTSRQVPTSSWTGESHWQDTLAVYLMSDNKYAYDRKIIEAALRSIELSFPVKLEMISASAELDWTIWLSDQPVPTNMPVIYLKPESGYNLLVQETKNRWRITAPLNEEIALKENLTIQLASILVPFEKYHEVAIQKDVRMALDSSVWSSNKSDEIREASLPLQSADSYLIAGLLVLLLLERILAYHRNQ